MASLAGYDLYDADQHYYEAPDAFTRHLDPAYQGLFRWVQDIEKRRIHALVKDQLLTAIPNPTFNPVGKPGSLALYFRGENVDGKSIKEIIGQMEPIRPEYQDRAARVATLREQGVGGTLLLPTLALGIEQAISTDPPALYALFRAFNAWLDDDWGFAREGEDPEIIAPPLMSLVEPTLAEHELNWALEKGAKVILFRSAPVHGPYGYRSMADRIYDRFWAMCAEANIVVAFHGADCGYGDDVARWGEVPHYGPDSDSALSEVLSVHLERPIVETISAFLCQGVFDRHPELRVATIEFGSGWVPDLLRRLRSAYGKAPNHFRNDPVEQFQDRVYVAPFQENNIPELLEHMNTDRVLFGSDWPHPEGTALPGDFLADIATLQPQQQFKIMHGNLKQLARFS